MVVWFWLKLRDDFDWIWDRWIQLKEGLSPWAIKMVFYKHHLKAVRPVYLFICFLHFCFFCSVYDSKICYNAEKDDFSERHVKHLFAGQNIQHTGKRSKPFLWVCGWKTFEGPSVLNLLYRAVVVLWIHIRTVMISGGC